MKLSDTMTARPGNELTVGNVPRHAARIMPAKCALDDGRRHLTFGEMDEQVERLASALVASGVGKGDVVCAYLPNCIEYVLVVLAVARAGAVFSPINPRFKAYEISRVLNRARPHVIFTTRDLAATAREARRSADRDETLLVIVDPGDSGISRSCTLDEFLAQPQQPAPEVREGDFFSLMFTSGTTGEPKGALATHRARMLWVLNAAIQYGLSEGDIYLGTMPQVHSAGLTFTLMHLYVGATVRILEHFDPIRFLQIVDQEKVTSSLTVPTMLTMILEALESSPGSYSLSSLKRVVTCGAPLPFVTKRRVIEKISDQLYDYYGSTESNSMSVLMPVDQLRKPDSVGQPFTNVEIMIAGQDGKSLPPGQVGEIWCSNPSLLSCYADQPEETEAAFTGRWFHTGDLGYLDDENYLYIAGRSKDLIISGGVNIYPAEIEQVLMAHPAVLDCAVIGVADPKWGQAVKAFVVLRAGHRIDLQAVQEHCSQYLADFKKPRFLELVAEIPKNAGGKTVKTLLACDQKQVA